MKFFLKPSIHLFIFLSLILIPTFTMIQAQNDKAFDSDKKVLIPCGQDKDKDNKVVNPCNVEHFILMIDRVIEFVLIYLVLPIAAIMFAYAGAKLMFSGDNAEARSQAKALFWNIVKGVLFIAGAWLIVTSILTIVGIKEVPNILK